VRRLILCAELLRRKFIQVGNSCFKEKNKIPQKTSQV